MCAMISVGMRPISVKLFRLIFKSVSALVQASMERRIFTRVRAMESRSTSRRSVISDWEML